jgi:deoxyribodipyrimidine photo-lyase
MQASQRTEHNHALEHAINIANESSLPLIVYFGITDNFPEANLRHYRFMLEGLKEVKDSLKSRGIRLVSTHESPKIGAVRLSKRASLVVVDRGYLKIQKQWRTYVASHIDCPLLQVETDVIVPVESASNKEEYSAATLRRKINRQLDKYLVPVSENTPTKDSFSLEFDFDSLDISDANEVLSQLNIDRSVFAVTSYTGGTNQARKRLDNFLDNKLDSYKDLKSDPEFDITSGLSPYLHFGQISPLRIAISVLSADSLSRQDFLEELIVRRELSMNFVNYNHYYYEFRALPEWAQNTLFEHTNDPRDYLYSIDELEKAKTHDKYWNAAQKEMVITGKMHGYMRMYWGKKIIEWTENPETAFKFALYLNNKYELDGRDPNGFAGVAWCFGKHDRPWPERRIYGNVRYMSSSGLERKFNMGKYVARVGNLDGRKTI